MVGVDVRRALAAADTANGPKSSSAALRALAISPIRRSDIPSCCANRVIASDVFAICLFLACGGRIEQKAGNVVKSLSGNLGRNT